MKKTLVLVIVCLCFSLSLFAQKGKQVTLYPQVTIRNNYPIFDSNNVEVGRGLFSVTGDNLTLLDNFYRDYNLSNSDPCVSAFGSSTFLMYPRRDGCPVPPARNFRLYIPEATLMDPNFPQVCRDDFIPDQGAFYINAWRMYFSNLYGTVSKRNPVVTTDARFGFWCNDVTGNSVAYAIIPWGAFSPQISPDGRIRRIVNLGPSALKADLLKPHEGGFVQTGVQRFDFFFDITTEYMAP